MSEPKAEPKIDPFSPEGRKLTIQQSRDKMYEALALHPRIALIEVEYDGSGDEGAIESIHYLDKDNRELQLKDGKRKTALESCIESYVYELLPLGWENNDGARGTVTVDVTAKKADVSHDDRFTDYNHSQFEDP